MIHDGAEFHTLALLLQLEILFGHSLIYIENFPFWIFLQAINWNIGRIKLLALNYILPSGHNHFWIVSLYLRVL